MAETTHNTIAALEADGFVFSFANACVQALREAAENATPERMIYFVARRLEKSGEPVTPAMAAAYLHTALGEVAAIAAGFRAGGKADAINSENGAENLQNNGQ
jgi:hypothetical protein